MVPRTNVRLADGNLTPRSLPLSVYLDCNATTPIEPAVQEAVLRFMAEEFGNSGSRTHEYGNRAKVAVQTRAIRSPRQSARTAKKCFHQWCNGEQQSSDPRVSRLSVRVRAGATSSPPSSNTRPYWNRSKACDSADSR